MNKRVFSGLRLLFAALITVSMVAACAKTPPRRLAETERQPPLPLTQQQKFGCITHTVNYPITVENANDEAITQAVDLGDCRDKVDSLKTSIDEYNATLTGSAFFNRQFTYEAEQLTCALPDTSPGTSPDRLKLLVDNLRTASNSCADKNTKTIRDIAAFNESLGWKDTK